MEHACGLDIPRTLEELCDPRRVALVVYDMQVGIVDQVPTAAETTRPSVRVLGAARESGSRVVFTRHMSLPKEVAGVALLRMAMAWQRVAHVDAVRVGCTFWVGREWPDRLALGRSLPEAADTTIARVCRRPSAPEPRPALAPERRCPRPRTARLTPRSARPATPHAADRLAPGRPTRPRRPEPVPTPRLLARVPRPTGDFPPLASRARPAQVGGVRPTPRVGAAPAPGRVSCLDLAAGAGEPPLGLAADPWRTAQAGVLRLRQHDPGAVTAPRRPAGAAADRVILTRLSPGPCRRGACL